MSEPTFRGLRQHGDPAECPGLTYLGIRKREASTTVELPSGGSIVIGGLVRDEVRQAMSGNPALCADPDPRHAVPLARLPAQCDELVIIATPYLVRPVERSKLARPDDNLVPEGDVATFSSIASTRSTACAKPPRPQAATTAPSAISTSKDFER